MSTKDEDSLFGRATKEEDEPISIMDIGVDTSNASKNSDDLETKKLMREEKKEERQEKRYFNAVRIFVGCLIFLGIVYGLDVVSSGFLKHELSSITEGIVEVVKTLLFTLSGYLFARNDNK